MTYRVKPLTIGRRETEMMARCLSLNSQRRGRAGHFLAGASLCALLQVSQAACLVLQPPSQPTVVGALAPVAVVISELQAGGAPSLAAFDFEVRYDPTILSLDGVTFGDPITGDELAPLVGSINGFSHDPVAGLVSPFEVSLELAATLDSLQPASFTLTTFWFRGLRDGRSDLELTRVLLGDSEGSPVGVDALENASVRVVVPEPAAAPAWFALSLGLVLWLRRTASGQRGVSTA